MPLEKANQKALMSMKDANVLRPVEHNLIDQTRGVIMVACGDGDQFPDLFKYQAACTASQRSDARIHTLSLNGGALLIAENGPFCGEGLQRDQVLLGDISVARMLKNIDTVVVYAHLPCGLAKSVNLSFEQVISLLVQAKRRIKRELCRDEGDKLKVAAFCHVDWSDGKRTYHVSGEMWDKWMSGPFSSPISIAPAEAPILLPKEDPPTEYPPSPASLPPFCPYEF